MFYLAPKKDNCYEYCDFLQLFKIAWLWWLVKSFEFLFYRNTFITDVFRRFFVIEIINMRCLIVWFEDLLLHLSLLYIGTGVHIESC